MVICPNCKEEIDNDSHYCDQCGQALLYCSSCGQVGTGRHCVYCGAMMREAMDVVNDTPIPSLNLTNAALGIKITGVNGAIIGRRQGPYCQIFEQNRYVSGIHAQLLYDVEKGWCIVDKNSSNGTRLNNNQLQPNSVIKLADGDMLSLANINLLVGIL